VGQHQAASALPSVIKDCRPDGPVRGEAGGVAVVREGAACSKILYMPTMIADELRSYAGRTTELFSHTDLRKVASSTAPCASHSGRWVRSFPGITRYCRQEETGTGMAGGSTVDLKPVEVAPLGQPAKHPTPRLVERACAPRCCMIYRSKSVSADHVRSKCK
jgi:hypothetical protein